tara:strand:- start:605 stop:787 length:183 start_codon:yes stop_codon:yes gene_type:complete
MWGIPSTEKLKGILKPIILQLFPALRLIDKMSEYVVDENELDVVAKDHEERIKKLEERNK